MKAISIILWLFCLPYYLIRMLFWYYADKKFLKNLKVGDKCYYGKLLHTVDWISEDRKRVRIKGGSTGFNWTKGNIPINDISKFKL